MLLLFVILNAVKNLILQYPKERFSSAHNVPQEKGNTCMEDEILHSAQNDKVGEGSAFLLL
jgi:hypothetical protein